MLNSFWEHPDEFKDTLKAPTMPFGYMPSSQDAADIAAPAASLRVSHVSDSHANSATSNSNYNSSTDTADNAIQQQYDNGVTGEDINAASLIHNIRNQSSSNNGTSTFTPGDFSTVGSWGSFLNPMTTDMSGHLENLTMQYTTNWQGQQNMSAHRHLTAGQSNVDMTSQLLQANMQSRYNNMQYTNSMQNWQVGAAATNQYTIAQGQGRPQSAAFGSDASFAGGRFQASNASSDPDGKAGNLLGVPGAGQAAAPGRNSGSTFTVMQQQAVAQPGQNSQKAAWVGMQEPPRKRRKSQADREHGASWRTDGQPVVKQEESEDDDSTATGHKRRRSVIVPQAPQPVQTYGIQPVQPSYSPEGDMNGRGGLKKKENLTDQQKRYNHIQSEKKRRELINNGYNTLNVLVPALAQGKSGLSRSECLSEVNMYLQTLAYGNATILARLGMPPNALQGVNRDSINPRPVQQQPQAASQQQAPAQPQPPSISQTNGS